MKKLIVNADDFGLTEEINHGIIQAHKKGILTSTSMVATGEAFDEAVGLALQNPTLDVGVHLTLVEERSILQRASIPTLINAQGYFRKSGSIFFRDYILNRIDMHEIYLELKAQIQKIRDSGISVSHIDSHQHIHVLPKVLQVVVELANYFQIKMIRAPFEQPKWRNFLSIKKWPRLMQHFGLNLSCRHARHLLKDYATDYFFGFFDGGSLNTMRLARVILHLPVGVSEVMCHPGFDGGRSSEKYAHWRYNWWDECCTLMHQSILDIISREKIALTSFRAVQDIGKTNLSD